MDTKPFETLIREKECKVAERWYPTAIDHFRNISALDYQVEGYHPLIDNIAYSLQYLEFLEKEFAELNVSSVIYIMLVKSYTITAMSIMEGIFTNIIKSNGWWKQNDEEVVFTSKASQQQPDGTQLVVKTEISKKISPVNVQMTLDEMIKCLRHHHQGLVVNHLVYPALNRLRDLRNRIHLQKGDAYNDHDYNAFDFRVKAEVQEILYTILCSPNVTDGRFLDYYDFLKPTT